MKLPNDVRGLFEMLVYFLSKFNDKLNSENKESRSESLNKKHNILIFIF